MPTAAVTAFACLALVLNLLGFMTVGAVLPAMLAEWPLTSSEAGWLGGALFGGCAAAVPVLVGLTDRILPRRIYLASSLLGAVSSALFVLLAEGFWSGFVLRVLTGVGLAGTYMPGLKALTDSLTEPARSRAATIYTSVFALGTAMSILVGGAVGDWFGWRWAFAAAGLGNLAAFVIGWLFLPDGVVQTGAASRRLLDIRPVVRNRPAAVMILAYGGHLWEMFGFRVWGVTFLVMAEGAAGGGGFPISPVTLATLAALAGVPASMAIGELAMRYDRQRVLLATMLTSVVLAPLVGWALGLPFYAIAILVLLYGMTTYGDSGTLSSGIVTVSEPALRGATMAVYSTTGFIGGLLGPVAVGTAIDLSGGIEAPGAWPTAFAVMATGSVFAAAALYFGRPAVRPGR